MTEERDPAARRRAEILHAALKLMSEKGYQEVGIADIASELGIGHGTFYRYFENKQDVALAALGEVIRRITQVVMDLPAADIDTLEQYRERNALIGNALFEFLEEESYIANWLSFEALGMPVEVTDRIDAAFELFADYTEGYVKNGMEKGFLRPDLHAREAARAVNAMMFEAVKQLLRTTRPREEARQAWSDTIIGLMLDGMGVRDE